VSASEGGARVVFDEATRAVARGQIAVFYEGDRVLGGGRIAAISSRVSVPLRAAQ
jgi:tRNA U34 2-thiouridine synthase MnmA/TrmU